MDDEANFVWLIRISVSQNLPESNKSSYRAGDVVKNTVKSWHFQMNFHSVEIFPRDVHCRKRHHSGSTLLHMRACAIGWCLLLIAKLVLLLRKQASSMFAI